MRRVRMIICGRVQGVGYRYYVQEKAKQNGIKGYVRNLPGGEVEVDAEGDRNELSTFILQCKEGPHLSEINNCYIHDIPLYGFEHFYIKH
ncbi:acylphosphatase [Labilibacter marinus]|uniref:acylphosphatase n=1 Tax=Labilibacter marinus TaxID=1477105 RepID=UPI00083795AC|nr:acylphosphatase [Labilibacter marinus]